MFPISRAAWTRCSTRVVVMLPRGTFLLKTSGLGRARSASWSLKNTLLARNLLWKADSNEYPIIRTHSISARPTSPQTESTRKTKLLSIRYAIVKVDPRRTSHLLVSSVRPILHSTMPLRTTIITTTRATCRKPMEGHIMAYIASSSLCYISIVTRNLAVVTCTLKYLTLLGKHEIRSQEAWTSMIISCRLCSIIQKRAETSWGSCMFASAAIPHFSPARTLSSVINN